MKFKPHPELSSNWDSICMKQKNLTILGWEWEMGLHDVVEAESKKAGINLKLLNIPREAMDKRAVDAGRSRHQHP